MSEIFCFLLGGTVATVILCCIQINRINSYQDEIDRLKEQLNNKK